MNYKHGMYAVADKLDPKILEAKREKERLYMQQYRAKKKAEHQTKQ